MESPVVVDKPPEYYGNPTNERGFPFDEEEGSGAWSELAARHPDIAARLRQRPATWARKRRPSSQDGIDDSADSFGGFDRFPFDDIPPEFREHFPSHWNRRFGPREEQFQQPPSPQPHSPQQQTTATQTEQDTEHLNVDQAPLPQYGLRNTVDLGQKSPADPSVVDADERSHRSMSAPPDHRTVNQNNNKMSGQNHQEQQQPHQHQPEQSSNVRHIPIFVEGRDEPVINKNVDHGTHFGETKPTYVPPPQPHIDREQYFADDGPVGFPFAKSFDRPFFRQGPQPFTKQKMYPQAYARGGSPQRSQSPKPQTYQEQPVPRAETPSRPQQKQPPPQQPSPQQRQAAPQHSAPQHTAPQHPPQNQAPPQAPQPPPQPQAPSANDPITQILSIQTDVLNLMTDVENFKGTKKDKKYLYLDEMLTRNLIKLDNIETDGKENIRQARKEAIKCIQKCIAVLEAKAENKGVTSPQPQDVEMQNTDNEKAAATQENVQNGDVEMKEPTKEEEKVEADKVQEQQNTTQVLEGKVEENIKEQTPKSEDTKKEEIQATEKTDTAEPVVTDTRPDEAKASDATSELAPESQKVPENTEKKHSPKKTVKKRDKSKDKKDVAKDNKNDEVEKKEEAKDNKMEEKNEVNEKNENITTEVKIDNQEKIIDNKEKEDVMQIDTNAKGDSNKADSQAMEVDAASQ